MKETYYKTNPKQNSWWQKLLALFALINLLLVFFNLSYLPLRDTYLRYTPSIVKLYDPVKGIEPHPDTEAYLQTVDRTVRSISQQGLKAFPTKQLLTSLERQSIFLIEENPFLAANKSSTFAKLKHRMEYRLQTRSAKEAFRRFWSQEYLLQNDTATELAFFADKIEPLLKINYYRRIDANGLYVDYFWRIDLFFIIFFAFEYLIRTFWIAKHRQINWGNAMLRYWYDLLMLVPLWRWLRIVPVTVRIHKSGLFNLEKVLAQITHEPTAYLSQRVSTFLIVRLLNQSQEIVSNGTVANFLFSPSTEMKTENVRKIDRIIDRLINLTMYKVLPQVQPDIEDLLRYSLQGALKESDIYQTVQIIPGIATLPTEAIEQLADYLARAAYDVLIDSYTDTEGKIVFNRLSDNLARTLRMQLQDKATQGEIEVLIADLLEEWKLKYLQASQQRNPETTLAEAEQMTEKSGLSNQ